MMRNFTEDQVIFREAYRKFLASEIAPHMEDWREAGIVDRDAFKKAGDLGFLHAIPATGAKGQAADLTGPAGQPALAAGRYEGRLLLKF